MERGVLGSWREVARVVVSGGYVFSGGGESFLFLLNGEGVLG